MACRGRMSRLWARVGRRKLVGQDDTHTSLHRCLSTLQLTAIGLGATIGVGIYVLLGVAIKEYAGPGVILSFILAGGIVLTNAVIFAEFGARIPHTGAAYTYIYRVVGELAAFVTGWMYLLSASCSGATGARAWSGFVDSLFNNSIQSFLDDKIGQMELGPPFARSLDWMAFTFYLIVTVVVSFNVSCSSIINTVLAVLTTGVLIFVTIAGVIIGDVKRIEDSEEGGFLPFGFQGVIVGASAAFYAFNGFDNISIAAEEAKDPVKGVPRAILIELAIVTVVYCGSAVGTVSLIPYSQIDLRAPIPSAFAYQGVTWARILVTIGPVLAITNLNILSLFALSRTAYRMAKDGLLFARFSYIHPRTKTPVFGVVVFGLLMAVASLLLELKDLVRFAVLCMLFQYILLAPALISLRAPATSGISIRPGQEEQADPLELEIEILAPSTDASVTTANAGNGVSSTAEDGGIITGQRCSDLLDPLMPGSSQALTEHPDSVEDGSAISTNHGPNRTQVASDNNCHPRPRIDNGTDRNSMSSFATDGKSSSTVLLGEDAFDADTESESGYSHAAKPRALEIKEYETEPTGVTKEFFKILTTTRTILLLVACLAGLALQIGMGWKDIRRASGWAIISISLLILLIIFFCEILRRRCESGDYEGFKVPLVPYLPALSCFLNMLLLVSAADVAGLVEFAVLVVVGVAVYVIMVLTEKTGNGDVTSKSVNTTEHCALLAHEERLDDDSDGSL